MDWIGLAVLAVVAVGAACQVFAGVGFALVCAPLLLLTLGREHGIRIVLVLSIVLNAYVLLRTFRHVRIGDSVRLLLPALILLPPAVLFAGTVRGPVLTAVAGMVVVLATALVALGRPLPLLRGARGVIVAGAASGVFNVLAASSGPPVALVAAQHRWPPAVARGTLQAFGLPLNIATLALIGPDLGDVSQLGWAAGGLLLGTVVASVVGQRAPSSLVRPVTLTISGVGGAALVVSGITAPV